MALIGLTLRGPIEDAFIYRSTILCATYSKQLLRLDVTTVENALRRHYGPFGDACAYLMFHSRGLGADHPQVAAWHALRNEWAVEGYKEHFELDLSELEHDEEVLNVDADDVLDMIAYFNRLYLATDGGLYSTNVYRHRGDAASDPKRRMPIPTISTSVSYGAVAASCGDQGLQVIFDDFGWLGSRSNGKVQKMSDYSLRVEYASGRLLNYRSQSDIELFRGDVTRSNGKSRSSIQRAMTSMSEASHEQAILSRAFSVDHSSEDLIMTSPGSIMILANGQAWSRRLRTHAKQLVVQGPLQSLGRYEGRPIAVTPIADRVAVETTEDLFVISPETEDTSGECLSAEVGPVVSMRGFPRSKRYRNVAIASNDVGLNLIGIVPRIYNHTERMDDVWY